ncbi:hypothetical protein BLNAU_144 [Blattamonas nauphoetae]|uniref:BLOC-1-related complex subunit 5 n=1 Tax=Blattamonas nauphoetae TaxID=2049346 RepID=A0ABQ9YM60_9EUKA|nr:hypothetical protein BLNAU_144 [Blattamonas nauphoetae]
MGNEQSEFVGGTINPSPNPDPNAQHQTSMNGGEKDPNDSIIVVNSGNSQPANEQTPPLKINIPRTTVIGDLPPQLEHPNFRLFVRNMKLQEMNSASLTKLVRGCEALQAAAKEKIDLRESHLIDVIGNTRDRIFLPSQEVFRVTNEYKTNLIPLLDSVTNLNTLLDSTIRDVMTLQMRLNELQAVLPSNVAPKPLSLDFSKLKRPLPQLDQPQEAPTQSVTT